MTLSFPNLQILDKQLVQQKVIVVWSTKLLTSVNLVKNNKSFTKSFLVRSGNNFLFQNITFSDRTLTLFRMGEGGIKLASKTLSLLVFLPN